MRIAPAINLSNLPLRPSTALSTYDHEVFHPNRYWLVSCVYSSLAYSRGIRLDESRLIRLYEQASQGQYPPAQQSGQYPQQSGQYPSQQSGQYQSQQQQGSGQYSQQYGAPPAQANRQQIEAYKKLLQNTIQQKSLQNMIPPNHPNLERYAQRAASQIDQLCARLQVPREIGQDLSKLALFDIILYIGKRSA